MSLIDPHVWPDELVAAMHAETCTDATRCQVCHDDEAVYQCEVCEESFEAAGGCFHDGHVLCPADLMNCTECKDAERWVG